MANENATPKTVSDKLDGLDDATGNRLPYRLTALMLPSTVFSLRPGGNYPYTEGPNVSASLVDQVVTLAKVLARTYIASDGKTYDVFDMLATLLEAELAGK